MFKNLRKAVEVPLQKVICSFKLKLLIKGRCDVGEDVLHCLFDSPSIPQARNCTGEMLMMLIKSTSICKQDAGKFKCVRKTYKDAVECRKFCPKDCMKNICQK